MVLLMNSTINSKIINNSSSHFSKKKNERRETSKLIFETSITLIPKSDNTTIN